MYENVFNREWREIIKGFWLPWEISCVRSFDENVGTTCVDLFRLAKQKSHTRHGFSEYSIRCMG